MKDGTYVINLDEYMSIRICWIHSFYVSGSNDIFFDSFGVECIPKETKKIICIKISYEIIIE